MIRKYLTKNIQRQFLWKDILLQKYCYTRMPDEIKKQFVPKIDFNLKKQVFIYD